MQDDSLVYLDNSMREVLSDTLSVFIKEQAQKMLRVAIEAEVRDFVSQHADLLAQDGTRRIVRNGYLPERKVQTGIGAIKVKIPRVKDKCIDAMPIVFTSNLIPKYMRRSVTLDVLLPLLYLKGISTGDFKAALAPILGNHAKNLSANTISRLKNSWYDDYLLWQQSSLVNKHYVYWQGKSIKV